MPAGPHPLAALAAFVLFSACAQKPQPVAAAPNAELGAASSSILAQSSPAAGAIMDPPVSELVLHFAPPARLGEVIVTGPDGAMPMMVTAVGEVEHYALPLPDLRAGQYEVAWSARARGAEHRGRFRFTVR